MEPTHQALITVPPLVVVDVTSQLQRFNHITVVDLHYDVHT